ncbi:tRNA pseudouridine(55) synthase TruB [Brachyspira pilosicoli]|uniref:tRNA pseudouridine synthase B n=1 Tax=Brachyspira pilosicoli TaxID=52584 RepID=A0AAJ6GEP3_BRAPL|nr:tRNA pseudouridine(55) synthase TruB [Brachyspira pilosicoli]WIH90970.1 tRNA pseudouridine(55) synthase TruB [Brachyspira pilosicoli]WIH93261.1 tRNA pseudouridine(55) synthase TruB [Brachyspira pilosicoli]WIH95551.1 tRNA pseudouridine(55) synthase TruB [Brachyspira pilosicoli]
MKGFLIVNKPKGITSFDVIRKLKPILKEKRIGHVGTLDPFASGVLIIALGRYTKLFFLFDDLYKEYIAEGVFGESRDTDDVEGKVLEKTKNQNILSFNELEALIKNNFLGSILQKPPIYSAKKIDGKRAYDLARENKEFQLKSVNVFINNIELLEYNYPYFRIKTSVSKGTYIRSIVRDIGEITNNLAYTKDLIRTSIGDYNIDNAINLENINAHNIISFFDMFKNFDKLLIEDEKDIKQILSGNTKLIENINIKNKYLALVDRDNNLLAIINNINNSNRYSFIDV